MVGITLVYNTMHVFGESINFFSLVIVWATCRVFLYLGVCSICSVLSSPAIYIWYSNIKLFQ